MRATWKVDGVGRGGAPASNVAQEQSVPAPVGGWDALNPLAAMPPDHAVQLVNWFPQPGYVELRRGHLNFCDTGSAAPVETLMGYMGQDTTKDALLAATNGHIYEVSTGTATSKGSGYTNDRWQFANYAGTGGSFTFMVNGDDAPQYYKNGSITVPVITRSDAGAVSDFINVWVYRNRFWFVIKNSTKAAYLDTDSVAGTATIFDVGNNFINGGYLQAIGTFSTDALAGPTEFICFISSQGDVAVYNIVDPTQSSGINYRGRGEISQPVGYRCFTKIGNDLGVITLDGVLPISQVLTYDKAALIGASITKNIKAAITEAVREAKDHFGWSLTSYPRNTMAILNVPLTENSDQEQYVMNTITGAWARFTGQSANCWEVFLDKPYFGDNDGVVHIADQSAGDENQTLSADLQGAFNYFSVPSLKRWTMLRPNITIDQTYPVEPQLGINVDFGTSATLAPVGFNSDVSTAMWDISLWDQAVWPGDLTVINWEGVTALGYCASIRITVTLPWTSDLTSPKTLRVNGFDYLLAAGGFI